MEINNEEFIKKKKLLMQINSGELNKSILYYINEARTCPQDFSRHLMVDDDVDDKITKLSLFFKYTSIRVPPLELNSHLEKSSNDLLYHIISVDDGSSELILTQREKERNNLKQRLRKFNLMPVYYTDLIIIGVDDAIDALANIFINNNHRNKILSPDMKYIGIATGFLPSERLCIVIDIVNSFKYYNNYFLRAQDFNYNETRHDTKPSKYNYIRFTNVGSDEENENDNNDYVYNDNSGEEEFKKYNKKTYSNRTYFNKKFKTDKKKVNNIKYFNSANNYRPNINMEQKLKINKIYDENFTENKNDKIINLRISGQKCFSPSNRKAFKSRFTEDNSRRFKYPMSVSIEKKFTKSKYGEIYPVYHKKTIYDDGSILLQPYVDE